MRRELALLGEQAIGIAPVRITSFILHNECQVRFR